MVATDNCFLPSDLLQYAEMLLKESLGETNNYSWLKARHIQPEIIESIKDLQKLKPMVFQMTSENCAKIAVKLDNLTDGVYSAAAILSTFKKLVHEQYSIQLLESSVKSAKERKNKKNNRVQPILTPDGRLPTVSFILH
ncbi:unnamed protein product [Arctia plantaginis]|uniref:Uncharacterized protein n=1 Tax=Arctia plantaginis TaxID=874455 RepID=A0A8S1BQN5_ARCPL|nr:unnamed protein product [Arctia plantaginis]CAB3261994.1 unnamed protein product [Arctia plantaginis]